MEKLIILRSGDLIQKEGTNPSTSNDGGYDHSNHSAAVKITISALDAISNGNYVVWDENDLLELSSLHTNRENVIIVPDMRVCAAKTFHNLLKCAEAGCIVFSGIDSFYYDIVGNRKSKRVLETRFKALYQLPDNSYIKSRVLQKGNIVFHPTKFSWLTNGFPSGFDYYAGERGWILGILGNSLVLHGHGEIKAVEPRIQNSSIDDSLVGKSLPGFAIREYRSGGMFIYCCFNPRRTDFYQQLLQNLSDYEFPSESTSIKKEILWLRIIIVVLTGILFLLLAKDLLGDTWQATIGGLLAGIIIGIMGNLLTNLVVRTTTK